MKWIAIAIIAMVGAIIVAIAGCVFYVQGTGGDSSCHNDY